MVKSYLYHGRSQRHRRWFCQTPAPRSHRANAPLRFMRLVDVQEKPDYPERHDNETKSYRRQRADTEIAPYTTRLERAVLPPSILNSDTLRRSIAFGE